VAEDTVAEDTVAEDTVAEDTGQRSTIPPASLVTQDQMMFVAKR